MRPLLLLDIDGTLCPFGIDETTQESFSEYRVGNTPVWVGPHITGGLERLSELYEIHWCSGWEDQSNRFGELVGLPPLPHIRFESSALPEDLNQSWKLGAVERYLGTGRQGRPVAWVDDDIREDAYQWADKRTAPTLLVCTDPTIGISDKELDQLLEFGRLYGA